MSADDIQLSDDPKASGENVLKRVAERNRGRIYATVSGGYDSIVALYFAARSSTVDLDGILHLDTGIGIPKTQEYVEEQVEALGLPCYVLGDEHRYLHEQYPHLVRKFGFPGSNPIAHSQMQNNLKDKLFKEFARNVEGGASNVVFISGVRKHESDRRYQKLSQDGVQEVNRILWASPLIEFTDGDIATYMDAAGIDESFVVELLQSSGECLCGAFEHRERIIEIRQAFPEVAQKIFQLEFDALEQAARGRFPVEYALWAHGSIDEGKYEAKLDTAQANLLCSDCSESCGELQEYDPYKGDPLTPAEAFLQTHNLEEFWNWPFYCVPCDRVVQSPLRHRREYHPHDAECGLEGFWDLRKIELGASDEADRIITEPNGYDMHVNELTTSKQKAASRKHFGYYENYALSHCDDHDHSWHPFNGGPVRQCADCFAFDLTGYDPADPGPPVLEPLRNSRTNLTPSEQEAEEIHQTLSEFVDEAKTAPI